MNEKSSVQIMINSRLMQLPLYGKEDPFAVDLANKCILNVKEAVNGPIGILRSGYKGALFLEQTPKLSYLCISKKKAATTFRCNCLILRW
jgi:hypothetical protein